MPGTNEILETVCSLSVPDHELLRLIGKGSYGEVWLARNIMGTYRAVKIIRREFFDDQSPFDREVAGIKKFEPISRTHSGFVDVLQIGRNDEQGCLYYVMEAADDLEHGQAIDPDSYVPRTLGKALARVKRFPVEQCVQMGLALCQALHTLHRHGLVHRDIKPSNIVFINGVPKLADIGLVTESNNARSFVGTEGFIPPEGPGSERADIFSLGKALYEIASGRDRLDFPALPPQLAEFEDGEQFLELNECLLRACRLDPNNRYSSAREMYEDLALLASGKSLRKLRILERRWQNAKRVAVLSAGVAAAAAVIAWPIIRERQHAYEMRERQIGVRSANGIMKMDQGDLPGALREFSEIFKLQADDKQQFSVNQTRVASILANNPKLSQMVFLKGRVSSVELSADGQRILAVEKQKHARLSSTSSGTDLLPPVGSGLIIQASFSPQGDLAVVADESGWALIWDLKTGATRKLEHPGNVFCARFSPSGKRIATACRDGKVRIWDVATADLVREMTGHTASMRSVAFNGDERLVVSTATDFTARLWDIQTGKQIGEPMRHPSWVTDAAFSPDSKFIVTGCQDGWARMWKVSSTEELPTLMKHDDVLTRVGFSPDGAMILTASNDATVRLWDAQTTLPLSHNHVLRHSAGVLSAAFHSNGHQIVTGCWDGTVRVWDLAGSEVEPTLVEGIVNDSGTMAAEIIRGGVRVRSLSDSARPAVDHSVAGEVRALVLAADGNAMAALVRKQQSGPSTIQVWNPIGGDPTFEISPATPSVTGLQFSPEGAVLAVRGEQSPGSRVIVTQLIDARTGREWQLPASLKANSFLAFQSGTRTLAIGAGSRVALLDYLASAPRSPEISVPGAVRNLSFSADGRRLLVSLNDEHINPKPAVVVDTKTGTLTGAEFWHRDGVVQSAFSPDGGRVATGGEDRELLIWDAASPSQTRPPLLHRQQIRGLGFSPDGRRIGTVTADGVARIWDSETGFPITPPLSCERNQNQIILLPDGMRFATIQSPIRSWLWTLPRTVLSPEDAIAVSHLLNADLRSSGPTDTRQIADSWFAVKRKFPDLFTTTPQQLMQWHTKQVRNAEAAGRVDAVSFHRSQLQALETGIVEQRLVSQSQPDLAKASK
jgi:WD40 repeat protein